MSRTEDRRLERAEKEGRQQAMDDKAARKHGCTPCPYPESHCLKRHSWIYGYTKIRDYRDATCTAGKQRTFKG